MWGSIHHTFQVRVVPLTKGSWDIQPSPRRWIWLRQYRSRESRLCSIPGLQWSPSRIGKTRSWLWFTAMEAHQSGLDKIFSFSFFEEVCIVAGFCSAPSGWLLGGSCCRDSAETWTRRRRFGADSFSIDSSLLWASSLGDSHRYPNGFEEPFDLKSWYCSTLFHFLTMPVNSVTPSPRNALWRVDMGGIN